MSGPDRAALSSAMVPSAQPSVVAHDLPATRADMAAHPALTSAAIDALRPLVRRAVLVRALCRWVLCPVLVVPVAAAAVLVLAQGLFGLSGESILGALSSVALLSAPCGLAAGVSAACWDRARRRGRAELCVSALMVRASRAKITASGWSSTLWVRDVGVTLSPSRRNVPSHANLAHLQLLVRPWNRHSCLVELVDGAGRPAGTLLVRTSARRLAAAVPDQVTVL